MKMNIGWKAFKMREPMRKPQAQEGVQWVKGRSGLKSDGRSLRGVSGVGRIEWGRCGGNAEGWTRHEGGEGEGVHPASWEGRRMDCKKGDFQELWRRVVSACTEVGGVQASGPNPHLSAP